VQGLSGQGYVWFQNWRLVGDAYLFVDDPGTSVAFRNFYIETAATTAYAMYVTNSAAIGASYGVVDTDTVAHTPTTYKFGLVVDTASTVNLQGANGSYIYASSIKPAMNYTDCRDCSLGYGTYVDTLVYFSGCSSTRFLKAGAYTGYNIYLKKGIVFDSCYAADYPTNYAIGNAIYIDNPAGDAITIRNSNLKVGSVRGSATGGHAMAVFGNSVVDLVSAAPTISGTEGFLTFDGTTTTSGTWASIFAGGSSSSTNAGYSIVKKYA
jgi:hypothetical protein